MSVLYISYDGLADNLGRAQIIPYITGLSKKMGLRFNILTFEKAGCLKDAALISSIKNELTLAGARWFPLTYHKRPALIATAYDLAQGLITGIAIAKKDRIEFIHGRSFIGSVIAFFIRKILKCKVILDVRGFWPEERVEAGIWKEGGWLYKASKAIEMMLVSSAEEIIMLTALGRDEFKKRYAGLELNITVIPTCVDIDKPIRQEAPIAFLERLRRDGCFVITYIGSVSTWYMPDEMFKFFNTVKGMFKKSFFLVLTAETGYLKNRTGGGEDMSILSLSNDLVPQYLRASKVGLAFYKPGYSRIACCPTKLGEYLNSGIPVIINAGIGDSEQIIAGENVGVVITDFSEEEYERAARKIQELQSEGDVLRHRCVAAAKKYFSLNIGIDRYQSVYTRILAA